MKNGFDFKKVFIFLLLSLLLSSPFIYRAWKIREIYIYPDVREHVLDSVFFLRETRGLTIGDLTIKDVRLKNDVINTVIHEKYHGFLNKSAYDDLEQDYYIEYSYDSDTLTLVGIRK